MAPQIENICYHWFSKQLVENLSSVSHFSQHRGCIMVKKQANISVLISWHSRVSFLKKYLFIWLPRVLVAACELLVATCGIQL